MRKPYYTPTCKAQVHENCGNNNHECDCPCHEERRTLDDATQEDWEDFWYHSQDIKKPKKEEK